MKTKICTKCFKEKPATIKYFVKLKSGNLGGWCRDCHKKYHREYRQSERGKQICQRYATEYRKSITGHLRRIYSDMKQRCNNPKNAGYSYYGGRGIKNKFNSSDEFIDYVINGLQIDPRGLDMDRTNNNGHYEKGNIRFIIHSENLSNRRK